MPPTYVKPCVKRGKTGAADAEAICKALIRQSMRFVADRSCAAISDLPNRIGHRQVSRIMGGPLQMRWRTQGLHIF